MKTRIILINGSGFQSGKDTFADMMAGHFKRYEADALNYKLHFADELKLVAERFTGIKRIQHKQSVYENEIWDFTHKQKNTFLDEWNMTLGQWLQKFATEAVRDNFDKDTWKKLLERKVVAIRQNQLYNRIRSINIFVPDFRFLNEQFCCNDVEYVDVYKLKIHREFNAENYDSRSMNHRSETELKDFSDWSLSPIQNNKDLEHLYREARTTVTSILAME